MAFFSAGYTTSLSDLGWAPVPTYFGTSYKANVEFEGSYSPVLAATGKSIRPTKSNTAIPIKGIATLILSNRNEVGEKETSWSLDILHQWKMFPRPPGNIQTLNTRLSIDPTSISFVNGKTLFLPSRSIGALNPTTSTS